MRDYFRWIYMLYRRNRAGVLIALALAVIATLAELASIALYYPILAIFMGSEIATGVGMQLLTKMQAILGSKPNLEAVLGILVSLMVIRSGFIYISRVIANHYELQFNLDLKRDFLRRFTTSTWDFLIRAKTGSLLNIFSQYTTSASRGFFYLIEFMMDFVSCVGYLAFAVCVSPVLAIFIVIAGLIVAPILKKLYWRIKFLIERNISLQNELANKFLDYLKGFKTFKSMSLEMFYLRELDKDLRTYTANERGSYKVQAALKAMGEPLFAIIGMVFLIIAYHWFAVGMETIVIFFAVLSKTYTRLGSLQVNVGKLIFTAGAIRPCQQFDVQATAASEMSGGRALNGHIKLIELVDVDLKYPDGTRVFERVSFKLNVERGLFWIVGPSGIGKSTLLDLLCGLLLPSRGTYRINGIDVRELDLQDLRTRVGYVPQTPVLFNRSIKENISLQEDSRTDMDLLEEAARIADAREFIVRLGLGYDTIMGEEGASLSVGQIQRISIARALYKRPEIIFFDEPTSALDPRSAGEVMKVIEQVARNYPVFLISHSERTHRNVQALILVDNKGVKIIEASQVKTADTS